MGYDRTTTKIWHLCDPIAERVFESANVISDESLINGIQSKSVEKIVDIQSTDGDININSLVDGDAIEQFNVHCPLVARLPIILGELYCIVLYCFCCLC